MFHISMNENCFVFQRKIINGSFSTSERIYLTFPYELTSSNSYNCHLVIYLKNNLEFITSKLNQLTSHSQNIISLTQVVLMNGQ